MEMFDDEKKSNLPIVYAISYILLPLVTTVLMHKKYKPNHQHYWIYPEMKQSVQLSPITTAFFKILFKQYGK